MVETPARNDVFRTRRQCRAAALCLAALMFAPICRADDRDQTERTPFAVFSVASVDRVLDDLEFVLDSAGQADRMAHIKAVLQFLNQLDGIDRDRPLGLLLYLPASPPHEPQAVAFLPITSLDQLDDTLRRTEQFSIEHASNSDRFELNTPEKSFAGLHAGNWIFLTEEASLLDEQLPDHLATAPADFERYDSVLTLHRDGISDLIVNEALSRLHTDLERDLQQQDDETSVQHQFRTRAVRAIFGLIEQFIIDAESMTIGLELSESAQQASLDIRLNVSAGSPLARTFSGLARPDSRFSAIERETAPLTIATTWSLDGEPAGIAAELLSHIRGEVANSLQQPVEQIGQHPFERILTVLSHTIDVGHMDGLVQFVDAPDGKLVLVAAAHVANADSLALALREIMQYLADSNLEGGQVVDVDALEVDDVRLHRIRGIEIRRQDRRLYGDDVALYVGAGRDAVWLALGGAETQPALRRVILAPPVSLPPTREPSQPLPLLEVSLHLSDWLALAGEGDSERERKLARAARLAFYNADEDGVRLQLFADETGLRLNVQADRGYIRVLGVALATRMQQ